MSSRDEAADLPHEDHHDILHNVSSILEDLETMALGKPMRDKIKDERKRIAKRIEGGRKAWRKVVTGDKDKRIRDHIKEEPVARKLDKISFFVGVMLLCMTEAVLLRAPQYMGYWFAFVMPNLIALRFAIYKHKGWEYFLFDFCYLIQVTCLIEIFIFPRSRFFAILNFFLANGPLGMSVIAWRNSFIFHSVDHVTSVFLHALPATLVFCRRWYPVEGQYHYDCSTSEAGCTQSWRVGMVFCSVMYCVWQCMYYWKTEVKDKRKLDEHPELQTSLRWLATDRRNVMNKLVLKICRKFGFMAKDEFFDPHTLKTKIIFITAQASYTAVTLLPVKIWYYSFHANLFFLLFIFSCSIWNGGNYYIDVFATHYPRKFKQQSNKSGSDHEDDESAAVADGGDSAGNAAGSDGGGGCGDSGDSGAGTSGAGTTVDSGDRDGGKAAGGVGDGVGGASGAGTGTSAADGQSGTEDSTKEEVVKDSVAKKSD